MARIILLVLVCSAVVGCGTRQGGHRDTAAARTLPAPNFDSKPIAQQGPVAGPAARSAPIAPSPARAAPAITGIGHWTPQAPPRPWRWIVIHHSATPGGSAAVFEKMHRARGWDELGYHFVIGNGTDSGNGAVEVGSRWTKQKHGAHAKTPDNRFNDFGIGICLVGNFDETRPTPQQLQSLARLTAHLMQTYQIPPDRVLAHSDTGATDCPGRYLPVSEVRRMAMQMLAASRGVPQGAWVQGEP